jgi:hypothetical protein
MTEPYPGGGCRKLKSPQKQAVEKGDVSYSTTYHKYGNIGLPRFLKYPI